MKKNEMVSVGNVSFKLPDEFVNNHPVEATIIFLSPVIIPLISDMFPVICKGVKYIVDTAADCYRFKVMAENGLIATNSVEDFEDDSTNNSIDA